MNYECFFLVSIYQGRYEIYKTSAVMIMDFLNNNKLSNIMKNKYCVLYMKNHLLKIMGGITVRISRSKNFG